MVDVVILDTCIFSAKLCFFPLNVVLIVIQKFHIYWAFNLMIIFLSIFLMFWCNGQHLLFFGRNAFSKWGVYHERSYWVSTVMEIVLCIIFCHDRFKLQVTSSLYKIHVKYATRLNNTHNLIVNCHW